MKQDERTLVDASVPVRRERGDPLRSLLRRRQGNRRPQLRLLLHPLLIQLSLYEDPEDYACGIKTILKLQPQGQLPVHLYGLTQPSL